MEEHQGQLFDGNGCQREIEDDRRMAEIAMDQERDEILDLLHRLELELLRERFRTTPLTPYERRRVMKRIYELRPAPATSHADPFEGLTEEGAG